MDDPQLVGTSQGEGELTDYLAHPVRWSRAPGQ